MVNKKGEVIAIATGQGAGDQSLTLAIASSGALALAPGSADTLDDWNARAERRATERKPVKITRRGSHRARLHECRYEFN